MQIFFANQKYFSFYPLNECESSRWKIEFGMTEPGATNGVRKPESIDKEIVFIFILICD